MFPDHDLYFNPELGLQPPPLGLTLPVAIFAVVWAGLMAFVLFS